MIASTAPASAYEYLWDIQPTACDAHRWTSSRARSCLRGRQLHLVGRTRLLTVSRTRVPLPHIDILTLNPRDRSSAMPKGVPGGTRVSSTLAPVALSPQDVL